MNGLLTRCIAPAGARLTRLLCACGALLPALLLALGLGGFAAPQHAAAQQLNIRIVDFAYAPSTITIHVGDALTWTNADGATHSATANDGLFDTGLLSTGMTSTPITFSTPGTYPYHCRVHGLAMAGAVIVVDPHILTPSFADVPVGYWAHDQIGTFAQRGITTGCGDNDLGQRLYCPERGVTRAEMATFLTRALGQDKQAPPATPTFADVPTDYWAYGQIEAFVKLGITTGCGTDDLGRRRLLPRPRRDPRRDGRVPRPRQGAGRTRRPATPTFADVPPSYWAYGWIERFFTLGVTTGCGDDDAGPHGLLPGPRA